MAYQAATFRLRYCAQAKACGYHFVLLHHYFGIILLDYKLGLNIKVILIRRQGAGIYPFPLSFQLHGLSKVCDKSLYSFSAFVALS